MKSKPESKGQASNTLDYRYWAFISYNKNDARWARWLHRAIETYGIPAQLVSHPTPAGQPAPKRFRPLFRDRDELPAALDLGAKVEEALHAAHYLIVICSPHAARSKWVNKEIETFQSFGRLSCVLAIIVEGEPNVGGQRECFPPALRLHEPIAADARPEGDGKRRAKLKLLAGMLGVNFDALYQRDTKRRIRCFGITLLAFVLLSLGIADLAWQTNRQRMKAIQARREADALAQSRQAQALAVAADEVRKMYPQRSILLAVEAMRKTRAPRERPEPAAQQALRDCLAAIGGEVLVGHEGPVTCLSTSTNGNWLALGFASSKP